MEKLILIIMLLISSGILFSQSDTSKVMLFILTDGSEFHGRIDTEDSTSISLTTVKGIKIDIRKAHVRKITEQRGTWAGGEFLLADPNDTHLFLSPTARSLKGGEGYFATYQVFFPFIAVGVTDWLSLSGGVSLIPGVDRQLIYFSPKIRPLHLENFDLSAGLFYASLFDNNFGAAIGTVTYGSARNSLTASLGWGFLDGEFSDRPLVVLGGELQVSNYVKIISENWIPPGDSPVFISLGTRFFGRSLSADLAMVTSPELLEESFFPFFPLVSFSYKF